MSSDWKQSFADTLRVLMAEKGWNQSELARRAGTGRDNISRYLNGKQVPTPIHLKRLADAFGVSPSALYPGAVNDVAESGEFSVELKLLRSDPTRAWVRIDQVMPTEIALQIVALANQAKPSQAPCPAAADTAVGDGPSCPSRCD